MGKTDLICSREEKKNKKISFSLVFAFKQAKEKQKFLVQSLKILRKKICSFLGTVQIFEAQRPREKATLLYYIKT